MLNKILLHKEVDEERLTEIEELQDPELTSCRGHIKIATISRTAIEEKDQRDFPGGPVIKTPHF